MTNRKRIGFHMKRVFHDACRHMAVVMSLVLALFTATANGEYTVPFMTEHRNITPKSSVTTNFYGSVTGTVTQAYVESLGFTTQESDPSFTTWTNGQSVALGFAAQAPLSEAIAIGPIASSENGGVAIGFSSHAEQATIALGMFAYALHAGSIVFSTSARQTNSQGDDTFNIPTPDPSHFYFNAVYDGGPNARTLQSYIDEGSVATWTNNMNIVAGYGATAADTSTAPFNGTVVIGTNSSGDPGATVMGSYSSAAQCAVAIGQAVNATDEASIAIGIGATTTSTGQQKFATAVGPYAQATSGATAIGPEARALAENSTAIGAGAYTTNYFGVAFGVGPDLIYLESSIATMGDDARSLQTYFDERSPRYAFSSADFSDASSKTIAAADGQLYSVSAGTNGVSIVLPVASAKYVQDFVIRLAPADTNGTFIADVKAATKDSTVWQFDYPSGTNAVFGTIAVPTYITFTQVSTDRWSVTAYPATKEDE